jgi:tetratricopeptide (TPR) repeat protein/tRNA A-37 threonylcarbamoyl transferase component Bud32
MPDQPSADATRTAPQAVAGADTQTGFAETPATAPIASSAGLLSPGRAAGMPRYRVLRPHAKDGLGEVFVAHDEELNREVALKEIQARHADNPASRSRFLVEAEITGRLEHPGIVPIYGLGCYADGRPFYAMRFVEGDNLKAAIQRFHKADQPGRDGGERRLAFRELLRRFVDVCNAVAFAHSRGVLHRDLKPDNVMLGKYGETLVVDWGLAKAVGDADHLPEALAPRLMNPEVGTLAGSALGTPAYMSPEQAAGELDRLGPASDVYGLGATLYALLTSKAPVEGVDVEDVLSKVKNGDLIPPRQVVPTTPAALDAVCRKAMALRPQDRYPGASELAVEVERWLADEPVQAYREPWAARAGRWVRRHRQLVTGAAALLLAAVPLSIVIAANRDAALRQAEQDKETIRQQKEVAEANERTATEREAETRAVLSFVENKVFAAARPEGEMGGLGYKVTLRQAVEAALPFVDTSFREQPLIEARLRMTLGQSFLYLGEEKIAAEQLRKAADLFTASRGLDHPDTLACMNNLATQYLFFGHFAEGLALSEKTLALSKVRLGEGHPETLKSMGNLASSYAALGRQEDAARMLSALLAHWRVELGPDHLTTLSCMTNLATCYKNLGRHEDALKLQEETRALQVAKLGPENPDTLRTMNNLANSYSNLGRFPEAAGLGEKTLVAQKAKLGPDHPDTLTTMNNLADVYTALGRHTDALKLNEQTLTLRKAKDGAGHPDTLRSMLNLAISSAALGRHADAVRLTREAAAGWDKVAPTDMFGLYDAACARGVLVAALLAGKTPGATTEADTEARKAMVLLKKAVAAGFKDVANMKHDTDLDALRGREDFKKLLADLEAGNR